MHNAVLWIAVRLYSLVQSEIVAFPQSSISSACKWICGMGIGNLREIAMHVKTNPIFIPCLQPNDSPSV
jgi:hypothetical protein